MNPGIQTNTSLPTAIYHFENLIVEDMALVDEPNGMWVVSLTTLDTPRTCLVRLMNSIMEGKNPFLYRKTSEDPDADCIGATSAVVLFDTIEIVYEKGKGYVLNAKVVFDQEFIYGFLNEAGTDWLSIAVEGLRDHL